MSAIILMDADDAKYASIIFGEDGNNLVFPTPDAADMWLQSHAKVGWTTRIVELEE